MNKNIQKISERLRAGESVPPVTVRKLLSWFGVQRRGIAIVQWIREELTEAGIVTFPDFQSVWIDGDVEFQLSQPEPIIDESAPSDSTDITVSDAANALAGSAQQLPNWIATDPAYGIGKLPEANINIVFCRPDDSINKVVTLMLAHDLGRIPVMTSEFNVKGIVTWKSIASKKILNAGGDFAREFMEDAQEVTSSTSIFNALPVIISHGYVLVRGADRKYIGIVTAKDLSKQFQTLTEPFLLLGEIEMQVRKIISEKFDIDEINRIVGGAQDARAVSSVDDLTFGDYLQILQNRDNHDRLGLAFDIPVFCASLDRIRQIRNDVMHFDPDGIGNDDLQTLRRFTKFLQDIKDILQ